MPNKTIETVREWFSAAEELGEYTGIRFGRLAPNSAEPEWFFLKHADYDGIGGLAALLRQRGAELERLLQIKYPAQPSLLPLLKSLPKYLKPRKHVRFLPLEPGPSVTKGPGQPPAAVAWHVFDEATTTQIRRACRKSGFTVNSFLLKHLTKAIRPSLKDESTVVPWMVPVNLRGKFAADCDTDNHSSYIGVKVRSYETVRDVHRSIYHALGKGEHWANWYAYQLGRFMTTGMRKLLIAKGLATSQWNLGGFSNLGDWDPEKKIRQPGCQGAWFFCPPVLPFQPIGAGCVTFQNRLTLTLQTHPNLTSNSAVPEGWMVSWVKEIDMDLVSLLEEPVSIPRYAA